MKGYVINLFSVGFANYSNDYGYWTGKEYFGDDIRYPGYEDDKHHENVKVYTSKKRAETMSEKLRNRCTYVFSSTVEEIEY